MNKTDKLENTRDCLDKFVKGWLGDKNSLNESMVEEPFIYFSIFGNIYSKEDLQYRFAATSKDLVKIEIVNYVDRINGNDASQYATVIGFFKNEADYQKHLVFAGSFANKLVKEDNNWKLHTVRFDLQQEDSVMYTSLSQEGMLYKASGYGDKKFISGWKNIDDRIGHNMTAGNNIGQLMINQDYDLCWYAIKENQKVLTEEEKLQEMVYKYAAAYDFASFHLLAEDLVENAVLNIDENLWTRNRDVIGYLKMKRKMVSRSNTSLIIDETLINGNQATVKTTHLAIDLTSKRELKDDSLTQFAYGKFTFEFEKANDKWSIKKISYQKD